MLVIAAIGLCFIPGSLFNNDTLDINLHDTYFVINHFHFYILYLKMVLMLVFLGRCIVDRFSSRVENCVLIIALFTAQQGCVSLIVVLSKIDLGPLNGWTIYPPLSALPKFSPTTIGSIFTVPVLSTIQIILTILLVIVAIITGKNWNKTTHETVS
jgi:heme/copper-type cytochrome/quinol oxidase subunit 1